MKIYDKLKFKKWLFKNNQFIKEGNTNLTPL